MVWYSHLFQNFPQLLVIHTVKGFGIVNKAEIDIFLELSCFFYDPADVGNLISGFSEFTLGRSIINVQSVAKPLIRSHILLNTREFILERSLINVKNAEKLTPHLWQKVKRN